MFQTTNQVIIPFLPLFSRSKSVISDWLHTPITFHLSQPIHQIQPVKTSQETKNHLGTIYELFTNPFLLPTSDTLQRISNSELL